MSLSTRYGADVNSMSDTGSTPVRSACFMTHLDIVKLLVSISTTTTYFSKNKNESLRLSNLNIQVTNNADIQRPNYNGGTCLINSVQSVELCEFLLKHGANVNAQDIQCKTALHYAIQVETLHLYMAILTFSSIPGAQV